MPVSERTYEQIALEDPDGRWELHQGQLREKPAMSVGHNRLIYRLDHQLHLQLDPDEFEIRVNSMRVRRGNETYYIPDLSVVPVTLVEAFGDRLDALEVYAAPLPLVVEAWSPSTGGYDIDSKLPEYQRRGDQELWGLHPFERTLRVWRRRPDGSYEEAVLIGGTIQPVALPGVSIDLDALFA